MRPAPFAAPALVIALALALALPAAAQTRPQERTITMTGEANAAAIPDIAIVGGGALTQARTAKEALEQNNAIMVKALAALKAFGIAEADISTSRLLVRPQMEYRAGSPPRISAYQASHRLTVKLRDPGKLGEAVDRMTEAGTNSIDSISFEVENWSAKLDDTRRAAIADAKRKAALMAEAAGAKLGKVMQISVDAAEQPMQPRAEIMRAAAPSSMGTPTPVANGEQTLRLQVSVTWELVD